MRTKFREPRLVFLLSVAQRRLQRWMAAASLIKRRADPDDGRAWRLWLTPAGRAALARSKAGLSEVNARLTAGFSEVEIDVVARWLTSLQTSFPRGEDQ